MGNVFNKLGNALNVPALNRSSSITHMPLVQAEEAVVDIENAGNEEPAQSRIESISKIRTIYNWIADNKTFCATVTTGVCVVGYLCYLANEIKNNEEGVTKINSELMCALNTFIKDVYNNVPNITEMEIWRNFTSATDAIMESYPPELVEKIKVIIKGCHTFSEGRATGNSIEPESSTEYPTI